MISLNESHIEALQWQGIVPPEKHRTKTICPHCSKFRKKHKEKCMTICADMDRVGWKCHHCNWEGMEWI